MGEESKRVGFIVGGWRTAGGGRHRERALGVGDADCACAVCAAAAGPLSLVHRRCALGLGGLGEGRHSTSQNKHFAE
jgi:hypothetical protein